MDKPMTIEDAYDAMKESLSIPSFEASHQQYNRRCEIYDEQHKLLEITQPRKTAALCLKHIPNSENTSLLDIGSGTGNVVMELRKANFLGQIDLLDANIEMLHVASKKNLIHRNIIRHVLDCEGDLPLKPEWYDAVTCIGCLYTNHVPSTCLKGILKVVKRGGQIVFNLMERGTPYAEEADGVVNQLTSTGEMQIIEVQEFDSITNGSNHPTLLYIGKRL